MDNGCMHYLPTGLTSIHHSRDVMPSNANKCNRLPLKGELCSEKVDISKPPACPCQVRSVDVSTRIKHELWITWAEQCKTRCHEFPIQQRKVKKDPREVCSPQVGSGGAEGAWRQELAVPWWRGWADLRGALYAAPTPCLTMLGPMEPLPSSRLSEMICMSGRHNETPGTW